MNNFQVQAILEEAMLGFFHEISNLQATVRPKRVMKGFPCVDVSFFLKSKKLTLTFQKQNGAITPYWVAKMDYNGCKLVATYNQKFNVFAIVITSNNNKLEYIKNL